MNKTARNQKTIEEMINSISKEKTLRQVLRDNKIAEINEIYQINPYEKDGGRKGLILDVQEKNADYRSKIMIDLKQGQPIINQVYDSLYDIGKDCSKRIIAYLNGRNVYDKDVPVADFWPVCCLVNNLQQYPLGIHLLEMNADTLTLGPHFQQEYFEPDQELPISEAPTREQFMAETFWTVYFDSFNGSFYEPHKTFSDGFRDTSDWGHLIYIDCSFYGEIQLYWDQKGVRFVVKNIYYSEDALQKAMDTEMRWLQDQYGTDSIEFKTELDRTSSRIIKYSDRPFDWLYIATPGQITEFAKAMNEDAWALRYRIEERIEGLMQRESA